MMKLLNSAGKLFAFWTKHIDSFCNLILDDTRFADLLPSNRYFIKNYSSFELLFIFWFDFRYAQLIYEELVSDPIESLSKLYHKLELPVDDWAIKAALRWSSLSNMHH